MKNKNWNKIAGRMLVFAAVEIIAVEVATGNAFADFFGKLFCGDRYMVIVDEVMSERVCGFNADMNLIAFCGLMLVIGLGFQILGRRKKKLRIRLNIFWCQIILLDIPIRLDRYCII